MHEAPLVALEGVSWGDPAVFSGVDLAIPRAGRIGLVGRSGAGKTTLAMILAGLAEPSAGRVRHEAESDGPEETGPRVGLVFQEPERGFFEETVLSDVSFGPTNAGCPPEEARRRAREALSAVGLDPDLVGGRVPETLSGGEARRVAIAGVLALGPRLLVFDEPTCGLDAEGVTRFREMLVSLRERGVAYFIVSHDLHLLIEECERILVLDRGTIWWEGPPERIRDGLPGDWLDDPSVWGGELAVIAEAMRARGWLAADAPITAAALAEAWGER